MGKRKRFQHKKKNAKKEVVTTTTTDVGLIAGVNDGNTERVGNGGNQVPDDDRDRSNNPNYTEIPRENAQFVNYYKQQKIVPEDEWDEFMATCRINLPVNFRITGFRSHAKKLLGVLKQQHFSDLDGLTVEGEVINAPKAMPWFPGELAWQTTMSRNTIRKCPELEKFHKFLIDETESGNISRQEAVSMIPPLLLDVKPHHKVLDMCAAPGSKTAQLIEMLHADMNDSTLPTGFIMANDVDNKRCYIMTHQAKRLNSPSFMIVNHDASTFPNLNITTDDGSLKTLLYDRVLCDVPCSGDGTLRKNYSVWRQWSTSNAINLHKLQYKIAARAVDLLEVGGLLVYSTCSFNPIEDEAIVWSLIQRYNVSLVDCSDKLPGLKRNPGVSSWKVISKKDFIYSCYTDVPERYHNRIKPSMFPPQTEQEINKAALHRCLRLLPHHQDTGGFFVAVLRKLQQPDDLATTTEAKTETAAEATTTSTETTAEVGIDTETAAESTETVAEATTDATTTTSTETTAEVGIDTETAAEVKSDTETADTDGPDTNTVGDKCENFKPESEEDMSDNENNQTELLRPIGQPPAKKSRTLGGSSFREDPYLFFTEDEPLWHNQLKSFYNVKCSFPHCQLLTRSTGSKKRKIYCVSSLVRDVLLNNEGRLKIINTGIIIWQRSEARDVSCEFRFSQEGVYTIAPYITARRVVLSKTDLATLLIEGSTQLTTMSDETQKQLLDIGMGSCIIDYNDTNGQNDTPCQFLLCAWRGHSTLRIYVPKGDRIHYLRLLDYSQPELIIKTENNDT